MNLDQSSTVDQPRKTIAIFYPAFMGGGAEAVVLWILQALHERYDLTLFTLDEVDFARLDTLYGTSLSKQSIQVKSPMPKVWAQFCPFLVANNKYLRSFLFHWLIRYFKDNTQAYDLVMSAYNAMDLGRPGIQYIHWIKVLEGKLSHRKLFGFSEQQLQENITICNSHTVAKSVKEQYGIESTVVFPPVVIDVVDVPWQQKENAFICSGRLTASKSPHKVIQILQQVRDQGFDIKLYLTGGGGGIYEWQYQRFVKKLVAQNRSWITICEALPYKDYVQLLGRCKYGIHYKKEPFGISIAEMVKAGAIPFVRSQGGQIEIVGAQNHELLYVNEASAIQKIIQVLEDEDKQQDLHNRLAEQRNLFSTHRFMGEIQQAVTRALTQEETVASPRG